MLNLFQHLTASLYLLPLLGEILKRVQDDMMDGVRMTFRDAVSHLLVSEGLLALAISRLEDGKLNSRGFSNPWTTSRFYN